MARLSHNVLWMAAANIASSFFNVIIFIYLARTLQPEALGAFSFAFAVVFFAANFIDLGLSTYGMREIARHPGRAATLVSEILTLRSIIAAALCVILLVISAVIPGAPVLKTLLALSSLMLFGLALATEWAFQGLEQMRFVFLSFATTSLLQLGLIYTFIKSPADVMKVPLLYFVAMVPITMLYLRRFRFRFLARRADFMNMFTHVSGAFVIWSISICAQVYNNLDVVMLGFFRKIDEVGYFTIVRRFIGGAAVLMVFLANAVFPRLSQSFGKDAAGFAATTRTFLKISAGLVVLALIPVIIFSDTLIRWTVGSGYLAASVPLRIMTIGLICVLINLPYSTGLVASGFEKDVLKQALASACLSIAANLVLIPVYGMRGAAVSFVLAEALALIWILTVYRKRITGQV